MVPLSAIQKPEGWGADVRDPMTKMSRRWRGGGGCGRISTLSMRFTCWREGLYMCMTSFLVFRMRYLGVHVNTIYLRVPMRQLQ